MKPLKHILCIDDDPDILAVTQLALEDVGGYRVSCLESGRRAIDEAAALEPDLILMDVMMPEMDGPSTLTGLRKQSVLASVPIVFMTARIQLVDTEGYLKQGADGVIAKPFDPLLIPDQINAIWERRNVP
ncbi:response regulator [Asticcacaulis machinosus]|uniref:Response regulator n=1 Tax=Asticcacaulis machinosus TaxID=2984211 RepID=A0ABT5HMS1_9CAUL|nr:response regulator [Asticcacaulis machinosus]MDC7677518.1 response regulator [Asticcacaulis machinosus]